MLNLLYFIIPQVGEFTTNKKPTIAVGLVASCQMTLRIRAETD